jgi:hypothetical protein
LECLRRERWASQRIQLLNKKEGLMACNRLLSTLYLLLACCAALVVPAAAQHFKQVTGTLTQVAAGRNEVFGIGTANQVYRYNAGTKAFVRIAGSLAQVAVGGGTLSQKDEVWGVNTSGQIYHFNFGTKTFNRVTGSLAHIVVGEGKFDNCHSYEVWGIDASDNIFSYNYCTKKFDQIAGSLSVIATGGGSVWGLNSSAQIYAYSHGGGFFQIAGSLQQIAVSVNDVWGQDGSGNIYRFNPKLHGFDLYFNGITQVATGGDGVWLVVLGGEYNYAEPEIFAYNSSLTQLAVGYGAGVWGIGPFNQVFTFVRP